MSFRDKGVADDVMSAADRGDKASARAEDSYVTQTSVWSVVGPACLVVSLLAVALAVGTYIGTRSARDTRTVETATWPSRAPETSAAADEATSDDVAKAEASTTTTTSTSTTVTQPSQDIPAAVPTDSDSPTDGADDPPVTTAEEPAVSSDGSAESPFDEGSFSFPTTESWEDWETWWPPSSDDGSAEEGTAEEDCEWGSRGPRHPCND